MDIAELAKQAPYLAAIVIIVWAFLNAQAKRDEIFLKAQADRDILFLNAIKESNSVVSKLADEVKTNSEEIIAHDTAMRETAKALLRTKKTAKQ